ncbi:MAG: sensor histidine kinase [Methylobacter sp.]|nr:sensor histidine kinase [Candidatus Methylobacter titanis]
MLKKSVAAFLLWMLMTAAYAQQNPPLSVNMNAQHLSLAGHVNFYSDKSAAATFEQARLADYQPVDGFPGGIYSPDAHWYYFTLVRTGNTPRDWILALGAPFLDDVQVWLEQADGHFEHYQLGDHTPFLQRPLPSRLNALPVVLTDDRPVQVYVRIHSISSLVFNAALWQRDAFWVNQAQYNFFHGLYFGMLIIVILIHVCFGLWLGQTAMLAYAGYVAALLALYLGINGYGAILVTPKAIWINDAITGIGAIGSVCSTVFMWDQLLRLKQHFPRIHQFYLASSLITASALLWVTTPFYQILALILSQFGLAISFFSLSLLIVLWLKYKQTELLFYLLAFVITTFGAIAQISINIGWLPQNLVTSNIYQAASLIHILIMGLGLTWRIYQLKQQKNVAEHQSVILKQRSIEQRRFVAMLSHEFATPLASIDRTANLLQAKYSSLSQQEAARLADIRASVTHLTSFVNSFLLSEALDHQALTPNRELCPVKPFMLEVITSLGYEAKARVNLTVTPPAGAFELDKRLINIAICNLIANALKYSTNGTKVGLAVTITADTLDLRVSNQTKALSEEELALLGTPYFRASTSVETKGVGLGFHFSREIIRAHGGTLTPFNCLSGEFTAQVLLPKLESNTES